MLFIVYDSVVCVIDLDGSLERKKKTKEDEDCSRGVMVYGV